MDLEYSFPFIYADIYLQDNIHWFIMDNSEAACGDKG